MEKTYNTVINTQGEANVKAEGKHVHGCSIAVVCIEEGRTFVSIIDAADAARTQASYMSKRLREEEMPTIKGKRYCYLSRLMESSDMVLSCLRDSRAENERRKADEDDARKWREYQAELERQRKEEEARIEAERKAKEDHEKAVAKAIAKIERRREISARLLQKCNEAMARTMEAEMEYEALTGKAYGATEE